MDMQDLSSLALYCCESFWHFPAQNFIFTMLRFYFSLALFLLSVYPVYVTQYVVPNSLHIQYLIGGECIDRFSFVTEFAMYGSPYPNTTHLINMSLILEFSTSDPRIHNPALNSQIRVQTS